MKNQSTQSARLMAAFIFALCGLLSAAVSAQTLTAWPVPLQPRADVDGSLSFDIVVANTGLAVARDVSVSEELLGGVLVSSVPNGTQSGSEWTWALGDVAPGETARVSVTIDGGTTRGAVVEMHAGTFRTTSAPGVVARTSAVELDAFLNTSNGAADGEVLAIVAAHGGDADALRSVVRDDVGYEAYRGSLRGARGAWWSRAGNGYDQATLAVSLMRAAGVPSRYAMGELSNDEAAARLAGMFPSVTRMNSPRRTPAELLEDIIGLEGAVDALRSVSAIPLAGDPAEALSAILFHDPTEDPALLAAARDHAWTEYHDGTGWVPFDPTGVSTATADSLVAELPESVQHSVELSMEAEIYNPAFGAGLASSQEVFRHRVPTARLEGAPMTVLLDTEFSSSGGLVFSTSEHRYTPQLYVGDALAAEGDEFVEIATSFPAATQLILGVTLTATVRGPGVTEEVYVHRVADRLGAAARSGLVTTGATFNASAAVEGLGAVDIVALTVGASDPAPYAESRYLAQFDRLQRALEVEMPLLDEINASSETGRFRDATDRAAGARVEALGRDINQALGAFLGARYMLNSEMMSEAASAERGVLAYAAEPRMAIVGVTAQEGGPAPRFDLARNDVRVVVPADVPQTAGRQYLMARGLIEAELEGWTLEVWGGDVRIISAATVVQAAFEQGIAMRTLTMNNVDDVRAFDMSEDARVSIQAAVANGRSVLVPESSPLIAGVPQMVWYEFDPLTGVLESLDENGHHMAALMYALLPNKVLSKGYGVALGAMHGFSAGTLAGIAQVLGNSLSKFSAVGSAISVGKCLLGDIDPAIGFTIGLEDGDVASMLNAIIEKAAGVLKLGVAEFIGGFNTGVCLGAVAGHDRVRMLAGGVTAADPPLPAYDSGGFGPLRRPMSADRVDVASTTAAMPMVPTVASEPWRVSGNIVTTATFAHLQGAMTIVGEGTVVNAAGETVSTGDFEGKATSLSVNGAVSMTFTGGAQPTANEMSLSALVLSSQVTGAVTFVGEVSGTPGVYTVAGAVADVLGSGIGIEADPAALVVTDGAFTHGGIGWSGVNGSVQIAPIVAFALTATEHVSVVGVPSNATVGVGGVLRLPVSVATSGATEARLFVEGPEGWDVSLQDGELVIIASRPSLETLVHVWAVAEGGSAIAGSTIDLAVTAGGPGLEVFAEYLPIYTTDILGMHAATVAGIEVRNTGSEAATIALGATVNAGFEGVVGLETLTLAPGETGSTMIAVHSIGATLPAVGTDVVVDVTATSADAAAVTSVTFDFPEVVGVEARFEPYAFTAVRGEALETTLTLSATGNTPVDLPLAYSLSQYMDVTGIPTEITMDPGESETFDIDVTVGDDALLGFTHGVSAYVEQADILYRSVPLAVFVSSPEATKVLDTAIVAESLGESTTSDALLELADTVDRVVSRGCTENLAREMEFRLRTLSNTLTGDDFALIAGDLWEEADEIADSAYSCSAVDLVWLCDTIVQIQDVLNARDEELGPRVFVSRIEVPATAQNGDVVNVDVVLENRGDAPSEAVELNVTLRQAGNPWVLGTVTTSGIAAGAEQTFTFPWDTSLALGTHAITAAVTRNRAYATLVVAPADAPPASNQPPVIGNVPPRNLMPREDVAFTVDVTDPDGDPVFLSAPVLPRGLRLQGNDLVGSINREGSYAGVLIAQDRYGAATTLEFVIDVAFVLSNEQPTVSSRPPRAVVVGDTLTYLPLAVDADGDTLTWRMDEGPAGATFVAGVLEWTPTAADVGRHWIVLVVSDGSGGETQQRFTVDVRASALGPDLVVVAVDVSNADLSAVERSGMVTVTVQNVGDSAAADTDVVLFEDVDRAPGYGGSDTLIATVALGGLAAGASAEVEAEVSGAQAFLGNLIYAFADATELVAETNEDNNIASQIAVDNGPYAYAGYRPTASDVTLLAPVEDTAFRIIDPATGDIVEEGALTALTPITLPVNLLGGAVHLDHFVVEAERPIQTYLNHEIFAPNFGADLIHPALDGSRVGRDFVVYLPTLTSNNAFIVTALEPASITLHDASGAELVALDLAAGQWWEPTEVAQGEVFALHATGDLMLQSVSVTGASVIPPASAAASSQGDVGREFRFSTRSRGAGGGAVGVMAYEDATYSIVTNDGFTLVTGQLAAGEVGFHPGLGERRGALLVSTGDVALLAGDIARPGADAIGLLGEDLAQWVGVAAQDFLVHSQEQDVGRSLVLAGQNGASVNVNGVVSAIGPFGALELPENQVLQIGSNTPVVVQTMGGGDRYFDYGVVLRRVGVVNPVAAPVLSGASIDLAQCAANVSAQVRVGNAGGAAIPGTASVELVAVSPSGETVVARRALGDALAPGWWVDLELEGAGIASHLGSSWFIRLVGAGQGTSDVIARGSATIAEATCANRPPVFISTAPATVVEQTEYVYLAQAQDPDGETLRYGLLGGPPGTSLRPDTGLIRWRAGGPATVSFAISAVDPQGEMALQTFTVEVVPAEPCTPARDMDSDGFCPPEDCDDTNPDVNPDAVEVTGDGVDNDCDPNTSDAVSAGGLSLAVSTDRAVYGPGQSVLISAQLTNLSATVGLSSFEATVTAGCPTAASALFDRTVPVPALDAGGNTTVTASWEDTDSLSGPCQASVSIDRDGTLLQAVAPFMISSEVTGTLVVSPSSTRRGGDLDVSWTLTNDGAAAIAETVTVGADGWSQVFAEEEVVLEPGQTADGAFVLSTDTLAPAAYRFTLSAGGIERAEANAAVTVEAELAVPGVSTQADMNTALGSAPTQAIVFRPLGPKPGGAGMGGRLQGVWTEGVLRVRVLVTDLTEEDDDTVTLALSADGASVARVEWTRADGALDGDGELEVVESDEGVLFDWVIEDAGDLALAADRTLGLRVSTVDGDSAAPNDAWLWANDPDPAATSDGVLVLGAIGDTPGGDVGPDVSPGEGHVSGGGLIGGCECSSARSGRGGMLGAFLLLALLRLPRPRRPVLRRSVLRLSVLRWSRWTGLFAVLVCATWAAGCDDSEPNEDVGGDAGVDVSTGDTIGADGSVLPPVEGDTGALDGEPTGASCVTDGDCASGICQEGADYSVCTQLCDLYPCPEGFSCEPYPGGVRMCVAVDICVDGDGDGFGLGRGCEGYDCDEANTSVNAGGEEVCDGVDDDCDGIIDEGTQNACGLCGAPSEELCNGIDDDCDGDIDEGVANACGQCGTAPVEVCNGDDDDCDGSVDEGVCTDCTVGDERTCYGGPDGTVGQGDCSPGLQRCQLGGWTACLGQQLPAAELCSGEDEDCDGSMDEGLMNACGVCGPPPVEVCNGVDDDCDGNMDEGVLSPCGGCIPCGSALIFPSEDGGQDPAIAPAPDGGITLGTGLLERHDIWVPHSNEGTVSRFDTRTGEERARYVIGEDPSRTAVDLDGNVWVGHRGDGLVTHIFGNQDDCIDRNGDGVIQTSRDLNNDGRITGQEVLPEGWADPMADECVHCQVRVGTSTDLARGVGVDADNFAWVGTWSSKELYKIDPDTCEIVAQFPTTNPETGRGALSTYGLAIDPHGDLWTSSYSSNCVARVDTREARVIEHVCGPYRRYGIAIGPNGHIWYGTEGPDLLRYDPVLEEWTEFPGATGLRTTTGLVVDLQGRPIVAGYGSNDLARFDPTTETWELFNTNSPPAGFERRTGPRGVTIDAEGDIWGICRGGGLVELSEEGEWLGSFDTVNSQSPTQSTAPYSYSDNTGFQLFNVVSSEGSWSQRLNMGVPVALVRLEIDAHIPEGTAVVARTRVGQTAAEVELASWSEYTDESRIDLRALYAEHQTILDVEVRLTTSDPAIRPVLRDVRVLYETADCREAGFSCPSGQACDRGTGGCSFVPRTCFSDASCSAEEYCDDSGACRTGCRVSPNTCAGTDTCDPALRVCSTRTAECRSDASCAAGSYCADSGRCESGCRVGPDSCPPRFTCDPIARDCAPLPPECAVDAECPASAYCGVGGRCLQGCRLGGDTCGVDERCGDAHACEPIAPDCVPADPATEICNGLDDDCDGEVDEEVTGLGTSCAVGEYMSGSTECRAGAVMCRADATPSVGVTEVTQTASIAVAFSSQWSATNNAASAATGPADVTSCGDSRDAWSPRTNGTDPEFLGLGFAIPVSATGVRVHETNVGGFVTRIDLTTADGRLVEAVWEGTDDTACADWFEASWPAVDNVTGVVIHTAADGYEEIDAVQLIGTTSNVPHRLEGTLTDVILPAGDYVSTYSEFVVGGNWIVEAGASFSGLGPWTVKSVSANPVAADIRDAYFDGARFDFGGSSTVRLLDSTLVAATGDESIWEASNSGLTQWVGVSTFNVAIETSTTSVMRIESSRLEIADGGNRELITSRGDLSVFGSELIGTNQIPRPADGIYVASGTVTIDNSVLNRFLVALETLGTSSATLRDSVVRDSDMGVRISSRSRADIRDNLFDGRDLGHAMVGVAFDALNDTGGGVVRDNTFELSALDRSMVLEPDVFHENSSTDIGGNTTVGRALDGAYALEGDGSPGVISVALVDGAPTYDLTGGVGFQSGAVVTFAPMRLRADVLTVLRAIAVRNGVVAAFDGVDFVQVGIDVGNTGEATITGGSFELSEPSTDWMVSNSGTLNVSGTSFTSTTPGLDATLRRHGGVRSLNASTTTISGARFVYLEYGVFADASSVVDVNDSTFERCKTGVLARGTSTLGVLRGTFTTETGPLSSVGIDLQFDPGGAATIDGCSFDLGDEDYSVSFEPDSFQLSPASSVSGLTYVRRGRGFGLRGASGAGDIVIRGFDGDSHFTAYDTVTLGSGAAVTVAGDVTIDSIPAGHAYINLQNEGTTLALEPGATVSNVSIRTYADTDFAANGATFTSDTTRSRTMLQVAGVATVTDSSFVGFERRQTAIHAANGGVVDVLSSTFTTLSDALWVDDTGEADLTGGEIEDCATGVTTYRAGQMTATGTRFIGGGEDAILAIDVADDPREGMSFVGTNLTFELGPNDSVLATDTVALTGTRIIALTGSTFVGGETGLGYRVAGTATGLPVSLAYVDPAQPSWRLSGTVTVNGVGGSLSVPAGVLIQDDDDSGDRQLNIDGVASAAIVGASFENVLVRFVGDSTGTVRNSTFSMTRGLRRSELQLYSGGVTLVDGNSFSSTDAETQTYGIYLSGDETITPIISNNTFDTLRYGVFVNRTGPVPALSLNTFVDCVDNTSGI